MAAGCCEFAEVMNLAEKQPSYLPFEAPAERFKRSFRLKCL